MAAFYMSCASWPVLASLILCGRAPLGVATESAEGAASLHVTRRGGFVRSRSGKSEQTERAELLNRAATLLHRIQGQGGTSKSSGSEASVASFLQRVQGQRAQNRRGQGQHQRQRLKHLESEDHLRPRELEQPPGQFADHQLAEDGRMNRQQPLRAPQRLLSGKRRQQSPQVSDDAPAPFEQPAEELSEIQDAKLNADALAPSMESNDPQPQPPGESTADRVFSPHEPEIVSPRGTHGLENLRQQYKTISLTLSAAQKEERGLRTMYLNEVAEQVRSAVNALAGGGLVVFSLLAACSVLLEAPGFLHWPQEASILKVPSLPAHMPFQVICLMWTFLATVQCVMILPDVLWLEEDMQPNTASSLTLMASMLSVFISTTAVRRLMRPWVQVRNRQVVLACVAGHLVVAILNGLAKDSSDPWRLGANVRGFAMGASRLGIAVSTTFGSILLMMTLKVMPDESIVQFSLCRAGVMCLGTGVGTFFAAASPHWVFFSWAILGCAAAGTIPEDLEPLLTRAPDASERNYKLEENTSCPQVVLCIGAAASTLMQCFLSTAFLTTAAAIYVTDFLLSGPDILRIAGSSIICGAFVIPLVIIAKRSGYADFGQVATGAAAAVALASFLFFTSLSRTMGYETAGLWLAFLANALAQPAAHMMSGILEGFGFQHAQPEGSFFNKENLVVTNVVFQGGMVRSFGPAAMMALYALGGSSLCALVLLVLACLACAGTFRVRDSLAAISGDHQAAKGGTAATMPADGDNI